MNGNGIINLFVNEKLQLPLEVGENDVYFFLKDHYNQYISLLSDNNLDSDIIKTVNKYCNLILEAIENYYYGDPIKAYNNIKSLMEQLEYNNKLVFYQKHDLNSDLYTEDSLNLYRVRKLEKDIKYDRKSLFHVPFSKRRHVSSSRFSIAGYPSLYLGTSPELCRIETNLTSNDKFLVSKFQINRSYEETKTKIYVLDLAIKPKMVIGSNLAEDTYSSKFYDFQSNEFINDYILVYPLIASCSIMVEKKDKDFYPEYIVPQLVMQWLIKKETTEGKIIYGIRYFSSRCKNPRIQGFNYVFPVKTNLINNTEDYCSILKKIFYLSKPILVSNKEPNEKLNYGKLDEIESNV